MLCKVVNWGGPDSFRLIDILCNKIINQTMSKGWFQFFNFELSKSKNKLEAMIVFEDMQILSRANNLAFYELLGDAEKINQEWDHYNAVTKDELMEVAHSIFRPNNKNTLFYKRK